MTLEEFKSYKRGIAHEAVRYKRGEITGEALYAKLYVTLGKETFDETESMMNELEKQ
ncbi:MAG: hypothetical protein FWD35_03600 [Oscillospiraceae bacterium]|nr:hypothetical protein [Oscillospiraceae bacterium]